MEQRWYISAFGSKPRWAETADMMEKADAVEMVEKADTEMMEKVDAAVEKGDVLETLASNLDARCIPIAIERWSSWLL
jgi:hypothetical protein